MRRTEGRKDGRTDGRKKPDIEGSTSPKKRGAFIGKVNSLLQEFHYTAPRVLLNLVQSYDCSLYGSNTWDLFSPGCLRLYRSYNVTLRNILNVHRTTHRYMLEPLSEEPHIYVLLLSRLVTFAHSLIKNNALEVRFLGRLALTDMSSVLGRSIATIATIADLCNVKRELSELSAGLVKKNVMYAKVPDGESWRIGISKDMMSFLNSNSTNLSYMTDSEAKDILDFACAS